MPTFCIVNNYIRNIYCGFPQTVRHLDMEKNMRNEDKTGADMNYQSFAPANQTGTRTDDEGTRYWIRDDGTEKEDDEYGR
jgi:hypothetical protein